MARRRPRAVRVRAQVPRLHAERDEGMVHGPAKPALLPVGALSVSGTLCGTGTLPLMLSLSKHERGLFQPPGTRRMPGGSCLRGREGGA